LISGGDDVEGRVAGFEDGEQLLQNPEIARHVQAIWGEVAADQAEQAGLRHGEVKSGTGVGRTLDVVEETVAQGEMEAAVEVGESPGL
jgi:hypothetical protein